ncbi:MAG TPA: HXXEE domain-containing protein [Thermoanaerobaculia bacterium]|nr:HXXEE domain-containing protein [Thermoanaerobaculia bacterium]
MLIWMPLIAATLHIVEEFVWPGGFAAWYRAYRPETAASVSARYLVAVNALLLGVCALAGVLGFTPRGAALFLTITAVLFGNALFHLAATIRRRLYSPGTITGVVLYLPLGVIGYAAVLQAHLATAGTAISAALLGGAYQLIANANHRRRAASM